MTNKQYKNIVNMTKNETSAATDAETLVRKTLKNCGVALPAGNIPEIKKTLDAGNYMWWKSCSRTEAAEYAANGVPVVGMTDDEIICVASEEDTAGAAMSYYSYGSGTTTTTTEPTVTYVSILFNPNGGSVSPSSEYVEANSYIQLPQPVHDGYNFLGWFTAQTGGSRVGGEYDSFCSAYSVTLYAHWEEELSYVTINFDGNGGTVDTPTLEVLKGSRIVLPASVRDGYTFVGWFTAPNGGLYVGKEGDSYRVDCAITLYAMHLLTVVVTLDSNTDIGSSTIIAKAGDIITLPEYPSCDNHTPLGWYTDVTAGNRVGGPNSTVMVNESVTLYVHWKCTCERTDEFHLTNYLNRKCLEVGTMSRVTSQTAPFFAKSLSYVNRQRWCMSGSKICSKHSNGFALADINNSVVVSNTAADAACSVELLSYGPANGFYQIRLPGSGKYLGSSNESVIWKSTPDEATLWTISYDKDTPYIHNGFDTVRCSMDAFRAAAAAGEEFACRYYGTESATHTLTATEIPKIHSLGLKIVSIYEDTGYYRVEYKVSDDDILTFLYTAEMGRHDAEVAYEKAFSLGQPAGTAIYFAIEWGNPKSDAFLNSMLDYFHAISAYLSSKPIVYKIGVYGAGTVCNYVKQYLKIAEYSFLAGSYTWDGYEEYDSPRRYNIKQGEYIDYAGCTFDDDTAFGADYGQW